MSTKRKLLILSLVISIFIILLYVINKNYIAHYIEYKMDLNSNGRNVLYKELSTLQLNNENLTEKELIKLDMLKQLDIQNYTNGKILKSHMVLLYNNVFIFFHDFIYIKELNELHYGITVYNPKKIDPDKIHLSLIIDETILGSKSIVRSNTNKLYFEKGTFTNKNEPTDIQFHLTIAGKTAILDILNIGAKKKIST